MIFTYVDKYKSFSHRRRSPPRWYLHMWTNTYHFHILNRRRHTSHFSSTLVTDAKVFQRWYLYTWRNMCHFHVCDRHGHKGWRRLIGSPKLQIIFHKRANKYMSLLRKMTCKDKASYESSPPCSFHCATAFAADVEVHHVDDYI